MTKAQKKRLTIHAVVTDIWKAGRDEGNPYDLNIYHAQFYSNGLAMRTMSPLNGNDLRRLLSITDNEFREYLIG